MLSQSTQWHKSVQFKLCDLQIQILVLHFDFLQLQDISCRTPSGAGGRIIHLISKIPSWRIQPYPVALGIDAVASRDLLIIAVTYETRLQWYNRASLVGGNLSGSGALSLAQNFSNRASSVLWDLRPYNWHTNFSSIGNSDASNVKESPSNWNVRWYSSLFFSSWNDFFYQFRGKR